ncbi:hypothetical protein [Clostridium butyricum]|uniref:hypothetical protein n=1 Tax=Clostridium butyricum TaxID=1492 RepID=UPI000903D074|nr:hypothetical protein [Clostridium butyricum]APF23017.1 hypothetical protein NPD4_2432 [Clostridium butyricum]
MLTQQQIECIDMLCVGTKTISQIAKEAGCARETLSRWKNGDEEFKAELYKRSHAFETGLLTDVQSLLKRKLGINIFDIANNPKTKEETRLKANQYLVDRVLGNTTTKIETAPETKEDNAVEDIDNIIASLNIEDAIILFLFQKQNKPKIRMGL